MLLVFVDLFCRTILFFVGYVFLDLGLWILIGGYHFWILFVYNCVLDLVLDRELWISDFGSYCWILCFNRFCLDLFVFES